MWVRSVGIKFLPTLICLNISCLSETPKRYKHKCYLREKYFKKLLPLCIHGEMFMTRNSRHLHRLGAKLHEKWKQHSLKCIPQL